MTAVAILLWAVLFALIGIACWLGVDDPKPQPDPGPRTLSNLRPPKGYEWMTNGGISCAEGSPEQGRVDEQIRAMLDAAQSVIYAWRWDDRPEVKIGLTTVGLARWKGDEAKRGTDDNPASHVQRKRIVIGFAAIDSEHLRAAERWAHRQHDHARLCDPTTGNPTEWFDITRNQAADTLVAVAERWHGYSLATREQRIAA